VQDYVKSIPMPPDFDPKVHFGDNDGDEEEEEEEEDNGPNGNGKIKCDEKIAQQRRNTTTQQSKPNLTWEKKRQLLFQIYDEEKIPAELLMGCCSFDGKDGP